MTDVGYCWSDVDGRYSTAKYRAMINFRCPISLDMLWSHLVNIDSTPNFPSMLSTIW